MMEDTQFVSTEGKSHFELWTELCDLISKHPEKISSLPVDVLIRSGLQRFPDQQGRLWCALADYYIRLGCFEKVCVCVKLH